MKRIGILVLLTIFVVFQSTQLKAQTEDEIYRLADVQPAYPGGLAGFFTYIKNDMVYPKKALTDSLEGRVFIEYVVEKDGSLSNIKILKKLGSGCDEEAVRLFESCAKWAPGKKNGKTVRVIMALPIQFKLPKPEPVVEEGEQ